MFVYAALFDAGSVKLACVGEAGSLFTMPLTQSHAMPCYRSPQRQYITSASSGVANSVRARVQSVCMGLMIGTIPVVVSLNRNNGLSLIHI